MAKHVRLEHENCRKENCGYCLGGLFTCTVCGASEGELPTDCPGATMSEKQRESVYLGKIDFIKGLWRVVPTNG